jgi:hypothetical protein
MSVPILICECGLRVKAPGATPGRVGRCPNCGSPLTMPESPAPRQTRVKKPSEPDVSGGYQLEPVKEVSLLVPSRARPILESPSRGVFVERKSTAPMASGFLPVFNQPETNWFVSVLYPLRGADGLGMIAMTGAVLWLFTILVPEYCLTLMGDADSMGASLLGYLIALVSILPIVIFFPLVILYWLQYLGRTLVSSAMGETVPPRSPDRNFDGFFHGISPWLIWLALGVGVGMLPFVFYTFLSSSGPTFNPPVAVGFLLLGLPYILLALMLAFLHDHALAATPWNVAVALIRLRGPYLLVCLFVAVALALDSGAFAVALLLRSNHFTIYILSSLASWAAFQWTSLVVMRILGTYYYHNRASLRWHHECPRWGITWRL